MDEPCTCHAGRPPEALPLATLGALIGDGTRAAILVRLTDGTARPAGELAALAGASPQAATAHLAKLVEGGLLRVERRGRHRVFSLASGEVAELIEGLTAGIPPARHPHARCDPALRRARFCYDHLAGQLGVAIFDSLVARGRLVLHAEGPVLSEAGLAWCRDVGVAIGSGRRPLLRLCADWTERRPHAGGRFGAALADALLREGHIRRRPGRREAVITASGRAFFARELGLPRREP